MSLFDLFASAKATRDARRCTQCSGTGGSILHCSRWHATHPFLRLSQVFAISFSAARVPASCASAKRERGARCCLQSHSMGASMLQRQCSRSRLGPAFVVAASSAAHAARCFRSWLCADCTWQGLPKMPDVARPEPAEEDAPSSSLVAAFTAPYARRHPAFVQSIARWLSLAQNVDGAYAAQRLALTICLPYSWWVCSSQLCHRSHVI